MQKIDIQITKAQIESFSVTLADDIPRVSATVALYTAGSKRITSYTMTSESWAESKFELPPEIVEPIVQIARRLEVIVVSQCNRSMAMIPVKTGPVIVPDSTPAFVSDSDENF